MNKKDTDTDCVFFSLTIILLDVFYLVFAVTIRSGIGFLF